MVVRPLSRATSRNPKFKDALSRGVQTTPRLKPPRTADFGYAPPERRCPGHFQPGRPRNTDLRDALSHGSLTTFA
eukprot:3535487-Pyramimonas_sp.AAC.1